MRCRTKKKLLLRSQEATDQQRHSPLVQLCERERSGGESKEMEERRGEEVESREEVEIQNQVVGHAQFASWGAIFSTSYVCYVTS